LKAVRAISAEDNSIVVDEVEREAICGWTEPDNVEEVGAEDEDEEVERENEESLSTI
jgi:hypothetical protein